MTDQIKNNRVKPKDGDSVLTDGYGRNIDYLRISLTDHCNLRCRYCMPREGIPLFRHDEILSLEEIYRIAGIMTDMGIRKIRLTGGEPLVRRNMISLVRRLGELPGKPELALTTNGVLLEKHLDDLLAAGLSHVNVSLDARDPDVFRELTGMDAQGRVEAAIKAAVSRNMQVKVNSVLIRGVNEGEIAELAVLARDLPVDVRFIELMSIGCGGNLRGIPEEEILRTLEQTYGASEKRKHGERFTGGPARYVTFSGFRGRIGFISPLSHHFCSSCNRVRLTADGKLKLCLFYPDGPALLPLIRSGCSDDTLREAILQGVRVKPEQHGFGKTEMPGKPEEDRKMVQIGG